MKAPVSQRRGVVTPYSPVQVAEALRRELERLGIVAYVNDGYGLAVVSVYAGLTVWSDGAHFWWRTDEIGRSRPLLVWHSAAEPARVARRVAFRYEDLLKRNPPAEPMTGDIR